MQAQSADQSYNVQGEVSPGIYLVTYISHHIVKVELGFVLLLIMANSLQKHYLLMLESDPEFYHLRDSTEYSQNGSEK